MPLYSDHYYYGSGQPPPYYLSSSPYSSSSSRISSPYSFPYVSPISALLSAGIGSNPMPRGLRSYSPMLSAISETGSPLLSRREIGNRSSPNYGKNYYRQRPVVIDTDNLDLSKRKREDNGDVESTPGMISRSKTIVRMHTRKLKENPELKKKKTQAEILMEKYFIKEKPVKKEEIPKRKRIWEEREEELNNTLARGGTIKRTNTVHKRISSPAPLDEPETPVIPDETPTIRKMSIDSELLKEEEALLDSMIQEELGLSNLKEMKIDNQNNEVGTDGSVLTRRKSKIKRDQIPYGRRKSSVDVILDENGVLVGKRKSHVRKKKTSKTLPLDELNACDSLSGSDSSNMEVKDDTKVKKRRSTKKKKPPKFKIDSLLVEEKSTPKALAKFQYQVIVEENKSSDIGSVKLKTVKHIKKEDIPKYEQQLLSKEEDSVKSDTFTNPTNKASVIANVILTSNVCDNKCDTLDKIPSEIDPQKGQIEKSKDDSKSKVDNFVKKTEKLAKGIADKNKADDIALKKLPILDQVIKQKIEDTKSGSQQFVDKELTVREEAEKKIKGLKSLVVDDANVKSDNAKILPNKNLQSKPPSSVPKTVANNTKQDIANTDSKATENNVVPASPTDNGENLKDSVLPSITLTPISKEYKPKDNKENVKAELEGKFITSKQKSLTPDLGRKLPMNVAPKSEPGTPIMTKKLFLTKNKTESDPIINKGDQGMKSDITLTSTTQSDKAADKAKNQNKSKSSDVLGGDKKIETKSKSLEENLNQPPRKEDDKIKIVKNEKEQTQQGVKTDKTVHGIAKKEMAVPKIATDPPNKGPSKIKEDPALNVRKTDSSIDSQGISKEKVAQLNTKNKAFLTRSDAVETPFSLTKNKEAKEKTVEKELDFNSNKIVKSPTANENLSLDEVKVSERKEGNKVCNTSATETTTGEEALVKPLTNNEKPTDKNIILNKHLGKDSNNSLPCQNKTIKPEIVLKNNLKKIEMIKKDESCNKGSDILTKKTDVTNDKALGINIKGKIDLTKCDNTPLNKDDHSAVKTKADIPKTGMDSKGLTPSTLDDRKNLNNVKQTEDNSTVSHIKIEKDAKQDKTTMQTESKPSESKLKCESFNQAKPPMTKPKSQEKPEITEVKGNQTNKADKSKETSGEGKHLNGNNTEKIAASKLIEDENKTIKVNKDKKKRIKSESDLLDDECSNKSNSSLKESSDIPCEKSQSMKEGVTDKSSKKKKKSKDKDSSKKKKKTLSKENKDKHSKKDKETLKTSENVNIKTTIESKTSSTETVTTTTVTKEEKETSSRELSKRSTRLLHFINKCMRLSEDDDNIFIDYSDEDISSSSSSEYSSESEYTSDSEEDTLTDDSSDECDVNCHRKCEKLMPNLCGVNQKLIVEALSSLRKGSSESRDHGSPTRRHSNAALSLEEESHRHGSGATGAGRVTPPATTIPKFRKYTMEDFQFLKVLGKGSFGKVLLAELRGTQYYYAVKCLKKDVVLEDDDVECTLIERKVLALGTNHPYLCHLFCTFQTESHLFFVMEYLNGGDLMFHIQQQGRFDEGRARFYAAEIVSGLKFLHKKGIVYRDLKLDNILLDFDGHVRIADFGMCKLQIYLDRTADTFCGTPDYMAPEILKGLKYNQCVDWWSFGILMYEMLVGESPFSGCDEDDLFWCICNRQPHYPRFITLEAKRILMQLLEKEASKRLGSCENGALEVMAHPFFNGLDWDRLERRELVPPFKPNVHPLDVHYFDKHFTAERACLTPIDPSILQSMDQTQFQGFSYTNPNVTD
ncbi:uncharacterized protein LOC128995361 isoform X2 [Macrosteles quadrilineatus]|uniref:uncharacterized protein LOC128995361 isoform X2 n=1 Tax=Macrosteles quadrilineatus TaxID=74068 RepID=UPI0023E1EAEE|nr:uncharacterized protein LOC128995361 isoform X2 [Macrosteles quadrilineatus]